MPPKKGKQEKRKKTNKITGIPGFVEKKFTLEEFLKKKNEHKEISSIVHEEEDTNLKIDIVRLDEYVGSEFMRFNFENPVYIPVDKIYFTFNENLMAIAGPFLYIHDPKSQKGYFSISKKFDITCDKCENPINYITTNIHKFYCEECWEESSDDENLIVVMAGELREDLPV